MADKDGLPAPFDDDLDCLQNVNGLQYTDMTMVVKRTFLPSGIAARSISTLACARTSADADMLTRKSVIRALDISHCASQRTSMPSLSSFFSHAAARS